MVIIYCFDTSGWTHLKRGYPPIHFPSLWKNIDYLINKDRIISPQETYEELEKQEDELFDWLKQRKKIFKKPDRETIALVSEILKIFPKLSHHQKPGPVADPFVIALARLTNRNLTMFDSECIVVSGETPGGSKKTKIPDVCINYNLKHFTIVDVICAEGWIF